MKDKLHHPMDSDFLILLHETRLISLKNVIYSRYSDNLLLKPILPSKQVHSSSNFSDRMNNFKTLEKLKIQWITLSNLCTTGPRSITCSCTYLQLMQSIPLVRLLNTITSNEIFLTFKHLVDT